MVPSARLGSLSFIPVIFKSRHQSSVLKQNFMKKSKKKKNQYKTENEFLMMEQEILSAESVETPKTLGQLRAIHW